jgi:hypothetical protein
LTMRLVFFTPTGKSGLSWSERDMSSQELLACLTTYKVFICFFC